MKKGYILGIDQGTTGTTILLIDHQGTIIHKYHQDFVQNYPQPGWVEHDPELIWQTVQQGLQEIFVLPFLEKGSVKGIGITNQRETIVIWDRSNGKPIYPAIVWQCRRTAERCSKLMEAGYSQMIQTKTGLKLDPYFSATKIEWLLNSVLGAKEKAIRGELACGTIDSWLIWKLTGGKVHATDYSNASRTMVFNIQELKWDPQLLELFHIPSQILPEVKPSGADFGASIPDFTGGYSIPIAGVLGDQQAALFGQGCLEAGTVKNTYGTGCFLLMNTGTEIYLPQNGLLTSIGWGLNGKVNYVLEGSVFVAGAVIQWLRDELGFIQQAADSETLANSVPDTQGIYLVPAFTGLGAPYWDPYARGLMVGLTRGVNRAHIVRAALEGIAYQVHEVVESLWNATGKIPTILRVDGGAAANNFLMQFQADISQITIQRNNSIELTGIGAAYIAGLTLGFWEDVQELTGLVTLERTFKPQMMPETRVELWRGWLKAVERAKGWAKD